MKRFKMPVITLKGNQMTARLCADDQVICDFCTVDEVVGEVIAEDFLANEKGLLGMPNMSRGCWTACNECLTLIEANDWKELLKRSVAYFFKNHPDMNNPAMVQLIRDEINGVHRRLRYHMKGTKRYA